MGRWIYYGLACVDGSDASEQCFVDLLLNCGRSGMLRMSVLHRWDVTIKVNFLLIRWGSCEGRGIRYPILRDRKSTKGLIHSLVLAGARLVLSFCIFCFTLSFFRLRLRRRILRHPRRAIIAGPEHNTNVFRYRNTSPSPQALFAALCLPTTRTALAVASPRSFFSSRTLPPRLLRNSTDFSSMAVP